MKNGSKPSARKFHKGDRARLATLPEWVDELPKESRDIFHFCHGHIFSIEETSPNGDVVLDVSPLVDKKFGGFMNDIRLEPNCLELVSHSGRQRSRTRSADPGMRQIEQIVRRQVEHRLKAARAAAVAALSKALSA